MGYVYRSPNAVLVVGDLVVEEMRPLAETVVAQRSVLGSFLLILRVFGGVVVAIALAISSIAALILGIGLYFSVERIPDPAAGPLIGFGFPYALSAVLLGISGWSALRRRTDWRGAILGSFGALVSGIFLLSRWPFTRRNFGWLPIALDGIWVAIVAAAGALMCFVALWLVRQQLPDPDQA